MATLVLYPYAIRYLGNGTVDWDTDTLKVALLTSSASSDIATADTFSDVSTYEITTAGGYTTGGITLTGATVTLDTSTVTFDLTDTVLSASGGDIDAHRYYYIYKSGTTNGVTDPGLLYGYDSLSSDVPATVDGTSLTLRWNSGGVFTGTV